MACLAVCFSWPSMRILSGNTNSYNVNGSMMGSDFARERLRPDCRQPPVVGANDNLRRPPRGAAAFFLSLDSQIRYDKRRRLLLCSKYNGFAIACRKSDRCVMSKWSPPEFVPGPTRSLLLRMALLQRRAMRMGPIVVSFLCPWYLKRRASNPPAANTAILGLDDDVGSVATAQWFCPLSLHPQFERMIPDEASLVESMARLAAAAVSEPFSSPLTSDHSSTALRDQHSKHHGCVRGTFIVRGDLPAELGFGLLQPGRRYEAVIRFSNAMGGSHSDKRPDGRGMAIKLFGISGERLTNAVVGQKPEQDFLLTNYPVFFARDASDYATFMRIVQPCAKGSWANIKRTTSFLVFFLKRPRQFYSFLCHAAIKTTNPLNCSYYSMTPFLLGGEKIVRYVVTPEMIEAPSALPLGSREGDHLRAAMRWQLDPDRSTAAEGPAAVFDFSIQIRSNPSVGDVEDASRVWRDPGDVHVRVARIEIPAQRFDASDRECDCENLVFNPWNGIAAHRPLGSLNRMRLAVYQASAETRHRINMIEPQGSSLFSPGVTGPDKPLDGRRR
jgi:Catalase